VERGGCGRGEIGVFRKWVVRLDVRAEFLARPELFSARPELSSARGRGRPSRANFPGLSRAFGSPGSARSSPKACYLFFVREIKEAEGE
jgi:hypothetical protein